MAALGFIKLRRISANLDREGGKRRIEKDSHILRCLCVCTSAQVHKCSSVFICVSVCVFSSACASAHFCLSPMLMTTKLASSQIASNSPRASLGGKRCSNECRY